MCESNQPFFPELICGPEDPTKECVLRTDLEKSRLKDQYCTGDFGQGGGCQAASQVYSDRSNTSRESRRMTINISEDRHARESINSASTIRQDRPKTSPFLVILTTEQARSIYLLRSASSAEGSLALSVAGKSSLVAELFGVSPKTIRDVWNRKTWTQVSLNHLSTDCQESHPSLQVTRTLWSEEEACQYERENMTPEQRAAAGDLELLTPKRRGRPPGSKDARPRKRRRAPPPPPHRLPSPHPACLPPS
jgi:hypothetical protein